MIQERIVKSHKREKTNIMRLQKAFYNTAHSAPLMMSDQLPGQVNVIITSCQEF